MVAKVITKYGGFTDFFELLPIEEKLAFHQQTKFDVSRYNDSLFKSNRILLPPNILKSVQKRKAEYLAGRILAKKTLQLAGVEDFPLDADTNRCPIWPSHLLGSITHTKSIAACLIVAKKNFCAVGVDIENILTGDPIEAVQKQVSSLAEDQIIMKSNLAYDVGLSVLFSAKESLFKGLYPHIKQYFGFSLVQLVAINTTANQFVFKLAPSLETLFSNYQETYVNYQTSTSSVLTYYLRKRTT